MLGLTVNSLTRPLEVAVLVQVDPQCGEDDGSDDSRRLKNQISVSSSSHPNKKRVAARRPEERDESRTMVEATWRLAGLSTASSSCTFGIV
jgi:hypothetical protein